jgi:hypothetical protein
MAEIFVERKDDMTYRALRGGNVVATGATQQETADKACKLYPNDTIFVERVRDTSVGSRDKWRRYDCSR